MNINWNKINKMYPEIFDFFCEYTYVKYVDGMFVGDYSEEEMCFCYCDLEKFFNDNEIELEKTIYIDDGGNKYYLFDIIFKNKRQYTWASQMFFKKKIKEERDKLLILKAFEFLEKVKNDIK